MSAPAAAIMCVSGGTYSYTYYYCYSYATIGMYYNASWRILELFQGGVVACRPITTGGGGAVAGRPRERESGRGDVSVFLDRPGPRVFPPPAEAGAPAAAATADRQPASRRHARRRRWRRRRPRPSQAQNCARKTQVLMFFRTFRVLERPVLSADAEHLITVVWRQKPPRPTTKFLLLLQ